MRKRVGMICCALGLVLFMAGPAGAAPVYLSGVTSLSGWSDVEQGATNYCWLASASNMLAYSGWDGGPSLASATDIFGYSTSHWDNMDGNPYYAVEWWFDGNNSHPAGTWPSVTPGGDFYSAAQFNSSFGFAEDRNGLTPTNVRTYVQGDVSGNRAFTMLLGNTFGGIHWLTGWGYETDGVGAVAGVYYTDSFDGTSALKYSALNCGSGDCYLDVYSNLYLISMESLAFNAGNAPPNNVPPPPDVNPVPEPTTLLLLGTGLSGLFVVRKRR